MKSKLALLLFIAAIGSTALVASAQQATYSLGTAASPQPSPAPAVPPPPARNPGAWTISSNGYSAGDAAIGREAHQLAKAFAREDSDSGREKIKRQLGELLKEQFDKRQKRQEDEIKNLEAQVKRLRDQVDKRQENRRDIIAQRLDQIVRESQGLGW